jgi:hypothetical protein
MDFDSNRITYSATRNEKRQRKKTDHGQLNHRFSQKENGQGEEGDKVLAVLKFAAKGQYILLLEIGG